ncbi:MAG: hypothetical protein ACAI38_09980 [Myxococcota bacterium]
MAINPAWKPYIPVEPQVDVDTVIAQAELEQAEDLRTRAADASVRLLDVMAKVQRAREEYKAARDQALAAMQQAQEAMKAAQGQAAEMARAAENAQQALDKVLDAAESAKAAAESASSLVESLEGSTDVAALKVAHDEAAKQQLAAEQLMQDAKKLVLDMAAMHIDLGLDSALLARVSALWSDAELAMALAQSQPAVPANGQNNALVLLPEEEGEHVTAGPLGVNVPDDDHIGQYQAELLQLLDGVTIPPELQARVDQVREALAAADTLAAQGLSTVAANMRAGWESVIQTLLDDLGVHVEEAGGSSGSPAASTSAPVIEPPDFLPPNPHFDGTFANPPPGGWFYGVGDHGRTGQDSIYEWLSALVTARGQESTHGHYLLAASDEVVTVERHLYDVAVYEIMQEYSWSDDGGGGTGMRAVLVSREEAIAHLADAGQSAAQIEAYLSEHERFMLAPGGNSGGDGGGDYGPTYGTRAQYLQAIGLPDDVPLDLQISFNNSGSGDGDAWLDQSHADGGIARTGSLERAYVALVDDNLAEDWVQIGDIGPLGDDIGQMLGKIYDDYGAKTPEQQEAIRNYFFRYDERFGIVARRDFIEAAVETNNNRRQGFLERLAVNPVFRAIITVVVSIYGGPAAAAGVNAALTVAAGGDLNDALRAGLATYLGGMVGAQFGAWAEAALGDALTPAVTNALVGAVNNFGSAVVRQLISDGQLDGRGLLAAALSGAAGGFVTSFTATSSLGQTMREFFGDQRGAGIMGSLARALVLNGGRLSPADLISALGVVAGPSPSDPWIHTEDGTDILIVEGQNGTSVLMRSLDGNTIVTMNPDGTFTSATRNADGSFTVGPYDPQGNGSPLGSVLFPSGTSGPAATQGFGPGSAWFAQLPGLNLEVSPEQWSELGELADTRGREVGVEGDYSQTFFTEDGAEWELQLHREDGRVTVTGAEQLPSGTIETRAWDVRREAWAPGATPEQWHELGARIRGDNLADLVTEGEPLTRTYLIDGVEWEVQLERDGDRVSVDVRANNFDVDNFSAVGTPELYHALEIELEALRADERERLTQQREHELEYNLANLPRIRAMIDVLAARDRAAAAAGAAPSSPPAGTPSGAPAGMTVPTDFSTVPLWVNPNPPLTASYPTPNDGSPHGEFITGAPGTPGQPGVYLNLLPSSQSSGVATVPNWIVSQFNQLFGTDITPSWTQFHLQAYIDNPLAFAMADGTMVISGHGTPVGISSYPTDNYDTPGRTLGAAELAQMIISSPTYDPTTVIVLAACYTGLPYGVAQQLSQLLPNPILGAPEETRSNPVTGTQYVDPNIYARGSNFLVYQGGRLVGQSPVIYGRRPGG